jgi:hypothetical protein
MGSTATAASCRKQLSRGKLFDALRELEPVAIAMEACPCAHYWGRRVLETGYRVLGHTASHSLGHLSYPSFALPGGIVPPPRAGHRRLFSEADRCQILAEAAAAVAALLETAKLNRVELHAYLKDVLERMANGNPMSRIDDLLPWKRPVPTEPVRRCSIRPCQQLDMQRRRRSEPLARKGSVKLIVKSTPEWYLYLPRCCSSDTGSVRALC